MLFLEAQLRMGVDAMAELNHPVAGGFETFLRCGFWVHKSRPLLSEDAGRRIAQPRQSRELSRNWSPRVVTVDFCPSRLTPDLSK